MVKHRKVSKYYETDCRSKAIEQIEFVEQLKELDANDNATDVGNNQSMLVLTILEKKKIKEMKLKLSQGSVTVL